MDLFKQKKIGFIQHHFSGSKIFNLFTHITYKNDKSASLLNTTFIKSGAGFSLIELVIAIGIFLILASGVMFIVINSYSNFFGVGDQQAVVDFAQEGMEAVQEIAANSWQDLEDAVGADHGVALNVATNQWEFSGTSDTLGDFTRVINVINVQRDDGNIVESGGANDIFTKRVTVTVSATGISDYILATYLTNWDYSTWFQTDWSDGDGYEFWSDAEGYDSSTTITATSTAGQLKLTSFKGVYDATGVLYSSKLDLGSTDQELHTFNVYQLVPTGCDVSIELQADDNSAFSSATTQTFDDNNAYYTTAVNTNMHDERWLRYKVTLTACTAGRVPNDVTPKLYSIKLNYR